MILDLVEQGHKNYNSNFLVQSLSTSSSRKHKWQEVQFDLLSLTGIKFAIFTVSYYKDPFLYKDSLFVSCLRAKSFRKVAGAGLFKTRYGLIAFIVVELKRTPTICMHET